MKSELKSLKRLMPPDDPGLTEAGLRRLGEYRSAASGLHLNGQLLEWATWLEDLTKNHPGPAPDLRGRHALLGKGVTVHLLFVVLLQPYPTAKREAQQRLGWVLVLLMAWLTVDDGFGRFHSCAEQASRRFRELFDKEDNWLIDRMSAFTSISHLLHILQVLEDAPEISASLRRRRIVSALRSFVEAATFERRIRDFVGGKRSRKSSGLTDEFDTTRVGDDDSSDVYLPRALIGRLLRDADDDDDDDLAPGELVSDAQLSIPEGITPGDPLHRIKHALPFAYHRRESEAHLPFRHGATPAEVDWLQLLCKSK